MSNWSKEQLARADKKRKELENKNPQAVLDAFIQKEYKIGGIKTLPLTLAHYVVLEKIKSPFVDKKIKDFGKIDNENLMKMCYVITHTAGESRALLAEGEECFMEAVFDFCQNIELKDIAEVGKAVGAAILQASATAIQAQKKTMRATPIRQA